jgi:hypothetical protein
MSTSRVVPEDRNRPTRSARRAARNATFTLAHYAGCAEAITRPAYPGSDRTVRDVGPLAGMYAARDLELAARDCALGYIRRAREAGCTWREIGIAMHLTPGRDPQQNGETMAEAAYAYAAGNPSGDLAAGDGRSFDWTCHACDQTISDRGLDNGPADDEHGHADGCPRLAATIAGPDTEWELEWQLEANWEAGQ